MMRSSFIHIRYFIIIFLLTLNGSGVQSFTPQLLVKPTCFTYAALAVFNQFSTGVGWIDKTGYKYCKKDYGNISFVCHPRNRCIHQGSICNGFEHCPNGNDEPSECSKDRFCKNFFGNNSFSCLNWESKHICVKPYQICNDSYECKNRSDEPSECSDNAYCQNLFGKSAYSCLNWESKHICVKPYQICNDSYECKNRSDEPQACNSDSFCQSIYGPNSFSCSDYADEYYRCVEPTYICDGKSDCYYKEDEPQKKCSKTSYCEKLYGKNSLSCLHHSTKKSRCIRPEWVCDGDPDCYNGEDEKNCQTAIPPIEPTTPFESTTPFETTTPFDQVTTSTDSATTFDQVTTSTAFESTTSIASLGNSWIIPAVVTVTAVALVSAAVIIVK